MNSQKRPKRVKGNLLLAHRINREIQFDGFMGLIVEGVQRVGKSAYVSKGLAYANGEWEFKPTPRCVKPDFESVKPYMVFKPEEFLDQVLVVESKQKALIWDDAGYWLFALDWYEPFVKAVCKWMQVAGTQFGVIILTSPEKSLISSKVLTALPNHYVCRVTRTSGDRQRYRPRIAKAYISWTYPDGRKGGVRTRWTDRFNAMLPDDYYNWYNPIRRGYLDLARALMKKEVRELQRKQTTLSQGEESEFMETVHRATGGLEKIDEVNEVLAMMDRSAS